jgi:hypothetical protein
VATQLMDILTAEVSRLKPIELFEVSTRMFCAPTNLLLLSKSLRIVLKCDGLDLVAVSSMFQ